MPNMIWLYRRPILDYWTEHEETLGAIVQHVLVHEIGHHFGLSNADMAGIEDTAEHADGMRIKGGSCAVAPPPRSLPSRGLLRTNEGSGGSQRSTGSHPPRQCP